MCEHYVARSATPFRLDELWPFTERLERYGIAGFGWGASWLGTDGAMASYLDVRAFQDDPGRERIGRIETTSALVHLRRPSKLSTLGLADTQPFADPEGRFSFSHNGDLEHYQTQRRAYRAAGRLLGRADSEVAARWLEDAWRDEVPVPTLLGSMHDVFGGLANLAVLTATGEAFHYAGNRDNPVFSFRLGTIGMVATGLYSLDRSLFRFAARDATDRRLVKLGRTVGLDVHGTAEAA